jgi:hypothetical protein
MVALCRVNNSIAVGQVLEIPQIRSDDRDLDRLEALSVVDVEWERRYDDICGV